MDARRRARVVVRCAVADGLQHRVSAMNALAILSTEAARISLQPLSRKLGRWRSKAERLWRLRLAGLAETNRLKRGGDAL
jgi:hypothetical protein